MPTHVYANNNEIASKASEGKSIAAMPNICFSPPAPPAGPLPLPYPNTGECSNTDKGTSKVFIKDKMSGMAGDSCFSKSMGDESATQNFNKGMITGAVQGKCYFTLWSTDVKMDGQGVPRHMDMVTHNHASQAGNGCSICLITQGAAAYDDALLISNVPQKITEKEIRIGIFFDGTYNSSVHKKSETHSNVVVLFCANDVDGGKYFKIYVKGVGLDSENKETDLGGACGGGMLNGGEARRNSIALCVASICQRILEYKNSKIFFDFFGFSRGATSVRHIANDIVKNKIPSAYSLSSSLTRNVAAGPMFEKLPDACVDTVRSKINATQTSIKFIGLFDTVSSLFPGSNVDYSVNKSIASVYYQIAAQHEFRDRFPLESLGGYGEEVVIPGCHSDIGGSCPCGSKYFELIYIGFIKCDGKGIWTVSPGVDTSLSKLFNEYANTYYDLIDRNVIKNVEGYSTNIRDFSDTCLNWISYRNNGIVLSINYARSECTEYAKHFLYIDFFVVRKVGSFINKCTCKMMLDKAKSNGVIFNEERISQHIYKKDVKNTVETWEQSVHISSVGDRVFYGNLYTVPKETVPEKTRKVILRPNVSVESLPKVRQGMKSDYSVGGFVHPHKMSSKPFRWIK